MASSFSSGSTEFPNLPFFGRLISHAHRKTHAAIREKEFEASYTQLCTDILHLRNVVKSKLSPQAQRRLSDRQEVHIALQAPGGYEFAVAFFAILALGAAVVPISPHTAPKELAYFLTTCKAEVMLVNVGQKYLENVQSSGVAVLRLPIAQYIYQSPLEPCSMTVSSTISLDPRGAGLTIFTSGTTGPPKACVLPREMLSSGTQAICDHFGIADSDAVLHCLPVHHAAGILISFLPFLLPGGSVEFQSGSFQAEALWKRWRSGGLTAFSGVPTMYSRMMHHFEHSIAKLPHLEREKYINGARSIRLKMCGTSALSQRLREKWLAITPKNRILERYGTTEFSSVILISPEDDERVPDGSVGAVLPGVHVKLSNGDEGELLVKAPGMFTHYLGQPKASKEAHDEHGFYKTGDIARRDGPYYFILGRASTDIIKSGGYKISALDIEREIQGLDYISEVAVVGVEDEEFGQRVAAAVILNEMHEEHALHIDVLRADLRSRLAGYKLPTILYVTKDLPKTAMGKVQKKSLVKEVFERNDLAGKVQMWRPLDKRSRNSGVLRAAL